LATLKTGTIRQRILIPNATPKQVYNAFLSSKQHTAFTGSEAKCSSKIGGRFSAWDGYITGRNMELVLGKKIVQEWMTTEFPEGYSYSILRISLTKAKNGGTWLAMLQSKVPASQVKKYDEGWHESYWNPMIEYFRRLHEAS
jgi:activator of HSP90 ATPase